MQYFKMPLALYVIYLLGFQPSVFAQSFNANTVWLNSYQISSSVSGIINSINVKEGQKITKDEVLISIDSVLLQHELEIAKANLASSEPLKMQADLDLNRAYELYDRTLLSEVNLKKAEFEHAKFKGEYDLAFAKKQKAEYQYLSATIKSPISGRVLSVMASNGMYVNNQQPEVLLTIVQDKDMHVESKLKVSQWRSNLTGKKVTVKINNQHYSGVIAKIAYTPVLNHKGIAEYPFYVRFKPKNTLPSGMPASIDF